MRFLLSLMALSLLSASASAQTKVEVLLDWFINPDHAPLIIAQQRGYFDEAGLEVTMIEPADPSAPPKLLAAGQGDFAISYQPQMYFQREAGLPLRAVAVVVDQPLNSLVVLADGPVKSIADLKGANIGYSVGGFETAVAGAMLGTAGLSADDVTLININFALTQSLLTKRVDAVIGAFRNFELNQLQLNKSEGLAFFPEDYGVPTYDELVVLARESDVSSETTAAFVAALSKAAADLKADPEGTWTDYTSYREGLDTELNVRAWKDTIPLLAADPTALSAEKYEAFGAFMEANGLIKKALPADQYIAQ